MTKRWRAQGGRTKKDREHIPLGQMAFALMSLFSLALVIRNSDAAIKYMGEGLRLCALTVIPSLFPFMVISDLVVRSGAVSVIGKRLRAPMRVLFGIGGDGGCAVLLGFLCGFPVGARAAVSMYERGSLSRSELERVLTFSNIPSSAFIINAVGISLFGSRAFGVALYTAILLSALLTGILQNILFKRKNKSTDAEKLPYNSLKSEDRQSFGMGDLTASVSDSAIGILKVCAFVVFFNALVGTLGAACEGLSLSAEARAIAFGLFELTGGISAAAALPSPHSAAILAALISGWSGLSVHFQIMSLCPDGEISFKPYFAAKLFQGFLCAALVSLYCRLAAPDLTLRADGISAYAAQGVIPALALPICFIFCAAVLKKMLKKKDRR
ncbi:MAG: hypothetical protein J6A83_06465 [Clostridia bacterium]|nr:hypothetical protein [Clostridia bacterium]